MSEIQNMKSTKTSLLACYGLIGLIVLMGIAYVSKMSSAVSAISDMNTQNISIIAIALWSSVIIGFAYFFAKIHGLGFRIFTIYNKESRPQMSWRMLIQLVTFIASAAIFWCIEYLFLNSPSLDDLSFFIFNSAWIIVGFILLTVLKYFIVMSVTTKILLPIDFVTSIKSSILNVIVLLVMSAPLIYIYSIMGGTQSKANSQMQKNTNEYSKNLEAGKKQVTSKEQLSPKEIDNFIGKLAIEFLDANINQKMLLEIIESSELERIKTYFHVCTEIIKEDKFIVGQGCKARECSDFNGIFILNTINNKLVLITYIAEKNGVVVFKRNDDESLKIVNGNKLVVNDLPNSAKLWLKERNVAFSLRR